MGLSQGQDQDQGQGQGQGAHVRVYLRLFEGRLLIDLSRVVIPRPNVILSLEAFLARPIQNTYKESPDLLLPVARVAAGLYP